MASRFCRFVNLEPDLTNRDLYLRMILALAVVLFIVAYTRDGR